MGNDGKIRNGIELKEAEDNCIQRIIRKILNRLKRKSEVRYSLSYDEEKYRYFDKEFLLKYLNEKYLNDKNKKIDENNLDDKNKEIYEKNLINDLITLKTYRDDVEQIYNIQDHFNKISSVLITLLATILGTIGKKGNYEDDFLVFLLSVSMIIIVYTNMIYNILRTTSKSESYKLKFITNAIYTLEAIKEDMDKNGYSGMKYTEMNSNVNDYQSDYKTDEKITKAKSFTENDEGRYEGLELTEVKEIRTYKARKNKYSPRAMHHRKRR